MILENTELRVEISTHGAEITRIFDKKSGKERLWNADGKYWKRSAPVLFPVVGKLYGGVMRTEIGSYAFSQHGFARDTDFECTSSTATSAVFLLRANDITKQKYPYAFTLQITYKLNGNRIDIEWHVENDGVEEMPFTIGGHPAFCFDPEKPEKKDYFVYVKDVQQLRYRLLDTSCGCAGSEERTLETDNGYFRLSEEMFANDALIFDHGQIVEAALCDSNRAHLVTLNAEGFPNFGIWSVKDAPFVCLEPWQGRTDDVDFTDLYKNKPGAVCLKQGETFDKAYSVTIG